MWFRPALWPTIFVGVSLVILVALGSWQLQRLEWKNSLIERVSAQSKLPPVALMARSEWSSLDLAEHEYLPVLVNGTFDHDGEIHMFTSLGEPKGAKGGPGFLVFTPLTLENGGTVYINRGFVPETNKSPTSRIDNLPTDLVEIKGFFRGSQTPGYFVPDPDDNANIWYSRDVVAMARGSGIADPAPFYIDAFAGDEGSLPQGGETRIEFRNSHFDYAMTWFGLAIVLLAFYLAYHKSTGRIGAPR